MFKSKNMTKRDAISAHRKLWKRIANDIETAGHIKNIHVLKAKYAKEICGRRIACDCFCCEYTLDKEEKIQCEHCLVVWKNGDYSTECMDGEYGELLKATNWREQHRLAKKIAQLPKRNAKLVVEGGNK